MALHGCHHGQCAGIPAGVVPFRGNTFSSHLQDLIEMVCRTALTVFAFIIDPISTGVGMAIGLSYGIYVGYSETQKGYKSHKHHHGNGGCGAGYLEELSGVHFPKVLNTIVAFGLTLEHLLHGCGAHHHHLPINLLGGLAGLSGGAWVGRMTWYVGRECVLKYKNRKNTI